MHRTVPFITPFLTNNRLVLINNYFFTKNFNELFDFIRHKIFHAEYRLKEISILQMKLLDI